MGQIAKIKAVILDLGGVLFGLDWNLSLECFLALPREFGRKIDEQLLLNVITESERGRISRQEFVEGVRSSFSIKDYVDDEEIEQCWNKMILDFPAYHREAINFLRQKYPVYVLSNINETHRRFVEAHPQWEPELFDGVFWSYELGWRKPEQMIYKIVTEKLGLVPENLLFFDDRIENVQGAKEYGWQAYLVAHSLEENVKQLFADFSYEQIKS